LIMCYQRVNALKRALEKIFRYKPTDVDLIISQDGNNTEMKTYIDSLGKNVSKHLMHQNRETPCLKNSNENPGYYYISQHYRYALHSVFSVPYEFAILLEEDIEIAPDFFSYILSSRALLQQDNTLFCISAWNDNGISRFIRDPKSLYRSDFFPGLGWMIHRSLWAQIGGSWPSAYWDDWIRAKPQRMGRHCIFPEISRTYTFGFDDGVSSGQFANDFLKHVTLNEKVVNWDNFDFSQMIQKTYDNKLGSIIRSGILADRNSISKYSNSTLVIEYDLQNERERTLVQFGLMSDEKDGISRGSYHGIITFWSDSNKVYLDPKGLKEEFGL